MTIHGRLISLFTALFLLVIISVAATYWGSQAQRTDALVINLAGRQRMLTQKMIWLALSSPDAPELNTAIEQFDRTLAALNNGGMVQYPSDSDTGSPDQSQSVLLPPAQDEDLRNELDRVAGEWNLFRGRLQTGDISGLQAQAPRILEMLDSLVSQYERRAQGKLVRVQIIQGATLLVGLALLTWGYLLTRWSIVSPLNSLRLAANRMAHSELEEPVPSLGDDELGEVGSALEGMRAEVLAARENLEGQVAKRTHELVSAFEFSQEIVADLDLNHLLQSVVDRIRSLTSADSAAVCLLEPDPATLLLAAGSDDAQAMIGMRQSLENDPAYRVVKAGETVTLPAECTHCRFLYSHSPGISAIAPLHSGDTTLGALCVVRPHIQPFDENETRALTLLANTAAVAIANARLIRLRRREAEHAAAHTERDRLAAELHDNLAQTLGFINLKIDQMRILIDAGMYEQSLSELAKVKSAIGGAYGQVRTALVGLSEPQPAPGEYLKKLAESINEVNQVSDAEIHLEINGVDEFSISHSTQNQSLHIIREALTNANRHARAKNVWIRVYKDANQAIITIEDDGEGFDPQTVLDGDHLGLRLMRERAIRSSGALTVESRPGKGTIVIATFPLEAQI